MAENWNLIGHQWAVDLLRRHVANGEARHAYLIAGPPGTGRRSLALKFAQAMNCTNPPAPGEPCGQCRDCMQTAKMQHPDLAVVQAESEGKDLKVDQVRAVQHAFSLKPYQSKYRVGLFLRFQDANANAQNALLKTLEEAPAHAILLLTADTPEQLLPTIVSRCEVLRLRPLRIEEVEQMLRQCGAESEKARLLAHVSGGRPGYARRLLADESLLETRTQRLDDLQSLLKSTRVQKFAYADKLAQARAKARGKNKDKDEDQDKDKGKDVMREALLLWLSFWRDVLVKASGATVPITNLDYETYIDELAGRLTLASARRVVADLELGIERLDRNVNPRLLAEVLFLDWPRV